jgi:hypothetical protein
MEERSRVERAAGSRSLGQTASDGHTSPSARDRSRAMRRVPRDAGCRVRAVRVAKSPRVRWAAARRGGARVCRRHPRLLPAPPSMASKGRAAAYWSCSGRRVTSVRIVAHDAWPLSLLGLTSNSDACSVAPDSTSRPVARRRSRAVRTEADLRSARRISCGPDSFFSARQEPCPKRPGTADRRIIVRHFRDDAGSSRRDASHETDGASCPLGHPIQIPALRVAPRSLSSAEV